MKPLLILSSLILALTLNAQEITFTEAEVYVEQLVQRDILNKKGKDALLQAIKKKSIEVEHQSTVKAISYTDTKLAKETILQFCAAAFSGEQFNRRTKNIIEQKIKPEDSLIREKWVIGGLGIGRGGIAECISPKRSTIGYTRYRTLEDFNNIGLINDMVYEDCKRGLLDSTVQDEVDLTELMLSRSIYYRYYDFNLKEQKEYIDKLVSMGILSGDGKEKLLNSYHRYELKTIPQMLAYSSRYVLVELSDYKPHPNITYPVIFQAIQTLLPDFTYQDLKIERIERKESDLMRIDLKLTFNLGTDVYRHIFFHDYEKQVADTIGIEKLPAHVDQDFHKGINKWLTNIESPYRLYTLNLPDKGEDYYGGKRVGLLLLKQGEAELITENVYLLSREAFDTRLSKRNIDKLINDFTEQGFFRHLNAGEVREARDKVASTDVGSLEELLLQFSKTVVLFDWETGNLENPYEDLTKQFEQAARGSFSITNIIDDYRIGGKG